MKSLLQTLKFSWDHMFVLSGVCLLYLLPDYLFFKYFASNYPGIFTGEEVLLAILTVLVVLLFASFRQAALVYVMNTKRLAEVQTFGEILLGTVRAGIYHWRALWVVNIIRFILMATAVVGAYFLARSFSVSGVVGVGIFWGTALAGTIYIFTRLAYFDFLIVLKQQSALDALRLSFKLTTGNWSLFLGVTAVTGVLAYFIVQEHNITLANEWIGDFRRLFLQMLLTCLVQVLCFMHFGNCVPAGSGAAGDLNPDSKPNKKSRRKFNA